jgi:hypothetical protein
LLFEREIPGRCGAPDVAMARESLVQSRLAQI